MGVRGLWELLSPAARRLPVETLANRILAVDASIWLTQFVKAMRDQQGSMVRNAHLLGLFRRMCKLLYFKIKPVFVFDGGVPALKRRTAAARRRRRDKQEANLRRTAEKLLLNQVKSKALQNLVKNVAAQQHSNTAAQTGPPIAQATARDQTKDETPSAAPSEVIDVDAEPEQAVLSTGLSAQGTIQTSAVASADGADGLIMLPESNVDATVLACLPPEIQYELALQMKENFRVEGRSRLVEKQTKPDVFSASQIDMFLQGTRLTKNLEQARRALGAGQSGLPLDAGRSQRIASDENRSYVFVKGPSASVVKEALLSSSPNLLTTTGCADVPPHEQQPAPATTTAKATTTATEDPRLSLSEENATTLAHANPSSSRWKGKQPLYASAAETSSQDSNDAGLDCEWEVVEISPDLCEQHESSSNNAQVEFCITIDGSGSGHCGMFEEATSVASEDDTELQAALLASAKQNVVDESSPKPKMASSPKPASGEVHDSARVQEARPCPDLPLQLPVDGSASSSPRPVIPASGYSEGLDSDLDSEHSEASTSCLRDESWSVSDPLQLCQDSPATDLGPVVSVEHVEPPEGISSESSECLSHIKDGETQLVDVDQCTKHTGSQSDGSSTIPVVISTGSSSLGHVTDELKGVTQEHLAAERSRLQATQRRAERDIETVTDEMFVEAQELLRLFGCPYIVSPMEAEAQCAALEQLQLVEGVITDDSDVFLFGAENVYRNMFDQQKLTEHFKTTDIAEELGLDRDKLISLAMLLGSDYAEGIRGIGIVNAVEIVNAFTPPGGDDGLREFKQWLETVDLDESGEWKAPAYLDDNVDPDKKKHAFMFKHRNMKRNWLVRGPFPSSEVRAAYVSPQVDAARDRFQWGSVNVEALKRFCYDKFLWSFEKTDSLLQPVLAQASSHTQTRIDSFFKPHRYARIRSRRLQSAVRGLTQAPDRMQELMVQEEEKGSPENADGKNKVRRKRKVPSPMEAEQHSGQTMQQMNHLQTGDNSDLDPNAWLEPKRKQRSAKPSRPPISFAPTGANDEVPGADATSMPSGEELQQQ